MKTRTRPVAAHAGVVEIELIERLTRGFERSPYQLNRRHETDAELVRIPGTDLTLAITTDGVSEEIETGLYADPWLVGWMTVTVNASDLAAVGAAPLGLLVSETLPPTMTADEVRALQQGLAEACRAHGLPLLGGDTNAGSRLHMGATAVGLAPGGTSLTRVGCRPGDTLYASGPLGSGTAFALLQLTAKTDGDAIDTLCFQPVARLAEGQAIRTLASACMDTSDGAVTTLDELMRLNATGIRVDLAVEDYLDQAALQVARAAGIPAWMLLAGPHGEFELIFTIPPEHEVELEAVARSMNWRPLRLGSVVAAPGLELPLDGVSRTLDTTRIRNLYSESGGDLAAYRAGLDRSIDR
jgi:thiamine-monophosphate kinase